MGNKTRIDVMVDLETLGTDFNAPIFQIAAAGFELLTGDINDTFDESADISSLTSEDGTVNGDTLKWWLRTNPELLADLLDRGDLTPYGLLQEFHDWLTVLGNRYDEVYLWGNGILFDNAIIRHKFESYGWKYPIFYRNDRDVRTVFELAQIKTGETAQEMYDSIYDKELVAHDAMNDVMNQVALVSKCSRILTKGGR